RPSSRRACRTGSSFGDDHPCGADHASADRVALLDDVDDVTLLLVLGRLREQRLVHVRVELAAGRDLVHSVALEERGERAVDESHAVLELFGCAQRPLEVVEDREQLLQEPLVRERDVFLPLPRGALLVVLEVGGEAEQAVVDDLLLLLLLLLLLRELFLLLPVLLVSHWSRLRTRRPRRPRRRPRTSRSHRRWTAAPAPSPGRRPPRRACARPPAAPPPSLGCRRGRRPRAPGAAP